MANPRPLSPHLGIYRWRVNMVQSSLHRLTGLVLSLGALVVTWGVVAAASGGDAWQLFADFARSAPGLVLWFVWIWALWFHLCNGIEQLFHSMAMDYGPQHMRDRRQPPSYWRTGWIVVWGSTLLTLVTWAFLVVQLTGAAA